MQLSPEATKCVVFVGFKDREGKEDLRGTAFMLRYAENPKTPDDAFNYLVTAKHNLWKAKHEEGASELLVRFNTRDGKSRAVATSFSDWTPNVELPEDQQDTPPWLDVAVLPCFGANSILAADFDIFPFSSVIHINDDGIKQLPITIGDEVFFPGLFSAQRTSDRNSPIIRCGNIAAMAGKLKVDVCAVKNVEIEGYLLEARSLGGLSGSPVFVYHPERRREWTDEKGNTYRQNVRKATTHALLGVVTSHYDERRTEKANVNMGIAVAVPFTTIQREIMEMPKLRQQRAEATLQRRKEAGQ
jgi:hypothetical protein